MDGVNDTSPSAAEEPRERPILGPFRCICDEPLGPYRVVDGGIWGSLACRRCARLLISQPASTPSTPRTGAPSESLLCDCELGHDLPATPPDLGETDALGRDWLDQAIDTLVLAIGAKGENGHILPGPARMLLENEVRRRLASLQARAEEIGTPDSGTYGELPAEVRALIQGYEWDNMTRDEQRAWLVTAVAGLAEKERKYERLREAVNDSPQECGPDCNRYGHGDNCPSCDPAIWLERQQERIAGLVRERDEAVREVEKWREIGGPRRTETVHAALAARPTPETDR